MTLGLFEKAKQEAALHIGPEAAEVFWCWGQILDPYGIDPELPEEWDQIGRIYFARSPGTDVWVCFSDLPEATRTVLWQRWERDEFDGCDELP